jgi:hypothetical protein
LTPLPPNLAGGDCVHGHFNAARGFGVDEILPTARQFITFLRDPFDRFVSQWAYLHKIQDIADGHTPEESLDQFAHWFELRVAEQRAGRNSRSLLWQFPRAVRECPRLVALEQHFLFIGQMERFQASVDALAGILGKPTQAVPLVNTSLRNKSAFERWRPDFERNFTDEIELYRACLDFTRRFAEMQSAEISQ